MGGSGKLCLDTIVDFVIQKFCEMDCHEMLVYIVVESCDGSNYNQTSQQ